MQMSERRLYNCRRWRARGYDTARRGWPARAPSVLPSGSPEFDAWHEGHASYAAPTHAKRVALFEGYGGSIPYRIAERYHEAALTALSH